MAGLCAPLSTLRRDPRGYLRMTRGRCGSLHLHRGGLSPPTSCRRNRRYSPSGTLAPDVNGGTYGAKRVVTGRVVLSVEPFRGGSSRRALGTERSSALIFDALPRTRHVQCGVRRMSRHPEVVHHLRLARRAQPIGHDATLRVEHGGRIKPALFIDGSTRLVRGSVLS